MTASRILSVAAVAAFASFGAQANDLYGTNFEAGFQSTRARSTVQAEAAQAVTQFKNFTVAAPAGASDVSRTTVRAEAVTAARAGAIALGDRS